MKVWLVRHAQPLIAPGICYGATNMPAESQATLEAAQALARTLPPGIRVVASPLQRCEQLAQCLRELRPDLPYITDARLAEMDFGCWEGQRWDAIPQADFDQWTAAFGTHRFGGRESVHEFMQRVAEAWTQMQRLAQDTVWITHAGVIGAASLLSQGVLQVEQAAQWPQGGPAFGKWRELQA
ncbi:histidine phosphatase family protein [Rhodoferax sp.]|uniref:histidine phosphatase family protein n=1 Tax=Rhodoferax sp. TaxID=50421 RepID=UPI001ED6C104|nr:histidine phosphatase family protein [Rhodoferax sp.]MBT9506860.1 histidine phosphatase family protein [Rhodoferax sp.]